MRTARRVARLALLALVAALAACQTQTVAAPDYPTLAREANAGTAVSISALREAFLKSADFADRIDKLVPLEEQAVEQMVDEPLRLGATGSAILDIYFGSLTGHQALARFYDNLGETESATAHRDWSARIRADIESSATGKRESPYRVLSASEAMAYLRERNLSPLGSMYHSTDNVAFMLIVSARADQGRLDTYYFDLSGAYEATKRSLPEADRATFSPGTLIGSLAHREDSAAQVSIGAYLIAQQRYADAQNWLRAASRTGNVIANVMLARLYQLQARTLEGKEHDQAMEFALEQYLHAIALGSDEAMFALGGLYFEGAYGEDNVDSGIALLRQAADLGNTDAMLWLGHLHADGTRVDKSDDLAADYFVRAAEAGDGRARVSYARFLLDRHDKRAFDPRAKTWLEEEAKANDAEAMLLLGNLHAIGVGVSASNSKALDWYKTAVKTSPDDANIVNEVAWTLTVTNLDRLRQSKYALSIMDHVMTKDAEARKNPAYLDTWAAAYAANGNFSEAIRVQQEAITAAESQSDTEVLDVLRQHLEAFQNGKAIIDSVP